MPLITTKDIHNQMCHTSELYGVQQMIIIWIKHDMIIICFILICFSQAYDNHVSKQKSTYENHKNTICNYHMITIRNYHMITIWLQINRTPYDFHMWHIHYLFMHHLMFLYFRLLLSILLRTVVYGLSKRYTGLL